MCCVAGKEGQPSKRRKFDPYVEPQEVFVPKVEVKIQIPEEIKNWLVDDWDAVTRQKKLVELPAKVTVDQILNDFVEFRKANKTKETREVVAICCANWSQCSSLSSSPSGCFG